MGGIDDEPVHHRAREIRTRAMRQKLNLNGCFWLIPHSLLPDLRRELDRSGAFRAGQPGDPKLLGLPVVVTDDRGIPVIRLVEEV